MILSKRADLIDVLKSKREKITLIVVLYISNTSDLKSGDHASIWAYNEEGEMINLSSYSNFLYNVVLNASQTVNLGRSYGVTFEDTINFNEELPAFTIKTRASNDPRLQGLFSQTMQDFYIAMKRGAMAFVGESEHRFNDNGVCFGVVEMFKPKFHTGEYVKFKGEDAEWVNGMVSGLDGGTGVYTVSHDHIETDVKEKELLPSNIVGASLSHRQADLATNLLERERQRIETDRIDKHPLDDITTNPDILAIIQETVQAFHDSMEQEYEAYGDEIKTVDSASGQGFHDFTNGRCTSYQFITLGNIFGSGRWPGNEEIEKKMHEQEDEAMKEALDDFLTQYASQLKEAGIDPVKDRENINYHTLYDKNLGKLAERLSEEETNQLDRYSYGLQFEVRYFNPTNRNRENDESNLPEIDVRAEMGGPESSIDHAAVVEAFTFSTLSELREKLTSCLNRAVEALK